MGCHDPILALICGYPVSVRKRLQMVMFVAHVDESGNGGAVFVAGAVTAKADPGWLAFSDDWQKYVLDAPPKIPYFKFNNEHQLSGASHEAKIKAAVEVVNRHVDRADAVIVDVAEYEIHFKGLMGVTRDNPVNFGYMQIIQQCALHLPEPSGKIEFVFDDMDDTQYLELLSGFRRFKEVCPSPEVQARLGSEPIRRDDKELLPLQAADLWSGLVRASYEGNQQALAWLKAIDIENRAWAWTADNLPILLSKSIQRFPNLTTGVFYENGKARSARLATDRKALREKE